MDPLTSMTATSTGKVGLTSKESAVGVGSTNALGNYGAYDIGLVPIARDIATMRSRRISIGGLHGD